MIKVKINDFETIELSKKHDSFCLQVVMLNTPTDAYIEVYNCKRNTAKSQSCELMKREDIKKVVEYYQEKFAEKILEEKSKALVMMSNIAYSDPLDLFDENSKTYNILSKMPSSIRKTIEIKSIIDDVTGLLEAKTIEIGDKVFNQKMFVKILELHGLDKSDNTDESPTDVFNLDEAINK
ncbi:hypothetical protein AB832_06325 [Flavobacteriaceae bacterium (ex Bugula neritina AB1)]|nr:hypothetical protein AB832_06325 [Flavobacteriaceae bacterium (ex Bugula neritina AB1)]